MSLKILCAGCSKDEREMAEAEVKRALKDRAAADAWSVSLVKMQGRWSVTLDAPAAGLRAMTVVAPERRLAEAILRALGGDYRPAPGAASASNPPRTPSPASAPSPPSAPVASAAPVVQSGGRQQCAKCGGSFTVQYESTPGEPKDEAPVACPHCWHINRVQIGAEAAFNRDYRAEKV